MEDSDPSLWFTDTINPNFVQLHRVRDSVYSGKTSFQSVQIICTSSFGRCLVLDDKIQSAEADEFIYHEALTHPAMVLHPQPEAVFVAGGGEGATLREVLRYRSVQRVVMIDIDQEAVDLCRRFLPMLHQGAFEDGRVELLHLDARDYLARSNDKFDVIIIDLTEPVQGGPACLLYTREFYSLVRERLGPKGIAVVQSGSCTLGELHVFTAIARTLKSVFPAVLEYQAYVPSFGGPWGFTLASEEIDAFSLSPEELDARLSERLAGNLRFYDGVTHQGMFCLPRYLRQELDESKTVITDEQPLFLL